MGATYQIANWRKLFPEAFSGTEPNININDPRWGTVAQLVGYYFSLPAVMPMNQYGDEPALLQNFRDQPWDKQIREARAQLQNFKLQNMSPTSFEQVWANWQAKFITGKEVYDTGYEMIFDRVNLEGNDFWEVQTVTASVTFREIQFGGDVYYTSHSDSKYTVYIKWYGAGAGIDMRALMSRKFAMAEDLLTVLRNQAYVKKAQIYYALIEAVSATENVAWQAPLQATLGATDRFYQAQRDAMTINKAIETIIEDCKAKGYSGDLTKETYIVLYDYRDLPRMKQCQQVTMDTNAGSPSVLNYNVIFLPTQMLSSTVYYYVILPKRKMQMADILDLTTFNQFNQTNYTQQVAAWMGTGGNIGDIEQVKRCAKS